MAFCLLRCACLLIAACVAPALGSIHHRVIASFLHGRQIANLKGGTLYEDGILSESLLPKDWFRCCTVADGSAACLAHKNRLANKTKHIVRRNVDVADLFWPHVHIFGFLAAGAIAMSLTLDALCNSLRSTQSDAGREGLNTRHQSEDSGDQMTVGQVIEELGMTSFHFHVIAVVWWTWAMAGWTGTLFPYIMDAASTVNGSWALRTGIDQLLSVEDISNILVLAGVSGMMGNVLLGYLSDTRGRMMATTISISVCAIGTMCIAFATRKVMLATIVILMPFSRDGICAISNCMQAEWVPSSWRSILLVLPHGIWNVGRVAITILWVTVSPTVHWSCFFLAASAYPAMLALYLIARGRNYESPRFYASNGQLEDCIARLRLLASADCQDDKRLKTGWDDPSRLRLEISSGESTVVKPMSKSDRILQFLYPRVAATLLATSIMAICLSFTSFGLFVWLIEYLQAVGAEAAVAPVMFAVPCGKIIANVVLVAGGRSNCIVDVCRRVPLLKVGFFGAASFLSCFALTTETAFLVLSVFIYNLFEEVLHTVLQIYITEHFPTSIRSTATGTVFMLGHLGSIASGAILGNLMIVSPLLPMQVMVGSLYLGFVFCSLLPPEDAEITMADRPA